MTDDDGVFRESSVPDTEEESTGTWRGVVKSSSKTFQAGRSSQVSNEVFFAELSHQLQPTDLIGEIYLHTLR